MNLKRNKIDFGFAEFSVIFTDKPFRDEKGHELFGYVDFDKYEIKIYKSEDQEILKETYLHEIIHVILYMFNHGEDPVKTVNEDLTNSITRGLRLLSKLNENLIEELL